MGRERGEEMNFCIPVFDFLFHIFLISIEDFLISISFEKAVGINYVIHFMNDFLQWRQF